MKMSVSKAKLTYSFTPRIHSNVLAWVKAGYKSERSKPMIENILRWENEGGYILDTGNQLPLSNPDVAWEQAG